MSKIPGDNSAMSVPQFHWLIAGQVVTSDRKDVETRTSINALLTTNGFGVTRKDLAKAQEALQRRFVTEFEQVPGRKIIDVFLVSVSNLGAMSKEEFHAGFGAEESPKHQELN